MIINMLVALETYSSIEFVAHYQVTTKHIITQIWKIVIYIFDDPQQRAQLCLNFFLAQHHPIPNVREFNYNRTWHNIYLLIYAIRKHFINMSHLRFFGVISLNVVNSEGHVSPGKETKKATKRRKLLLLFSSAIL